MWFRYLFVFFVYFDSRGFLGIVLVVLVVGFYCFSLLGFWKVYFGRSLSSFSICVGLIGYLGYSLGFL